jgi:hypothetical protein
VIAWVLLLAVVCVRTVLKPLSGNIYPTYAWAGERFAAGEPVYNVYTPHVDNYRYSPVVAAGFVPFGMLPWGPGGAIFRLIGAALFLGGAVVWFRRSWPGAPLPAALLALLPLAIGSINNGQANPHIVGLMLGAGAFGLGGRWAAAGACIAAAALFKGYPIALGMLLVLAAPARFAAAVVGTIAAGLALPYLLQSPEYVNGLYREWWMNMAGDDRTGFPLWAGYQDFHLLLRVVGWNMPREQYLLVEAGTGAACAAVLMWQRWAGVAKADVVANAVTLGLCWMTVFGPATESSTLILLAPVLSRELLDRTGQPRWARAAAVAGAGLFLAAIVVLTLPHAIHRPVIATGIQPLASVLVAAAAVARVVRVRPAAAVIPAEPLVRLAA